MKVFEVGGTTLSLALFVDVTNSKYQTFSHFWLLHTKRLLPNQRLIDDPRTLHSELVYNYSGSKHISESLKRCSISDSMNYILAARFGASSFEMSVIKGLIKGTEIGLEDLERRANQALIEKHYKLSALELGISSVSDAITCRIAGRDAL